MSKNKKDFAISGKGYYIALVLCAVAIAITGFLYYRSANENPNVSMQEPSAGQVSGDQTPDVQAVATQPGENPTEPPYVGDGKKPSVIRQPVAGKTLAEYSMEALSYNQTTRDWRVHDGVDIGAEAGTKVCAAADGTVYTVYEDDRMGTTVVIRHDGGYITRYASLAENVSVKAGDTVTAGQTIGAVGNTALMENAVGDHVHFSVSCNGKTINPKDFLG